jgi:hypothetical protein
MQQKVIEEPAGWVPFSADVRIVGGPDAYGRFYRDDHGSERRQSGPDLATVKVIDIRNYTTHEQYFWTEKAGWTRKPLPNSHEPRSLQDDRMGLRKMPQRITITEDGEVAESQSPEAWEAYEYVNSVRRALYLPALNMFEVFADNDRSSIRQFYFNIKMGPQAPALFVPPPGEGGV